MGIMKIFTLSRQSKEIRHGRIVTRRGALRTPFFLPDATRASVRGVAPEELKRIGIQSMVVNTYHLYREQGIDIIREAGGVQKFMNWDGPLLSDSGGYQVFSLIHKNPRMGVITDDGAHFRSVRDGSWHMLTPERAIQIQFDLGVDMMVCLDDPPPNHFTKEQIAVSVSRTISWAKRCRKEYDQQILQRKLNEKSRPLLFGVIQGGEYKELRRECVEGLSAIGFDGYGFGARHIDEKGSLMEEVLRYTAALISKDVPRFALGIGTPKDIVKAASCGWDLFDCVIPTREGRHGRLFLWKDREHTTKNDFYETINITNGKYQKEFVPIDTACNCNTCLCYTRAYVHHLFRAKELLGQRLASVHNLRFYMTLMEQLRQQNI